MAGRSAASSIVKMIKTFAALVPPSFQFTGRNRRPPRAFVNVLLRVQYSVFECQLEDEDVSRLRSRLEKLINVKEDRVRLYRFCLGCESRLEIYGPVGATEDPAVYIL